VLAHVAFIQGNLRDEFAYYQKALALDPRVAGDYSPYSCITLIRIASNYRWAHELEKAYEFAQTGLRLAERWREGNSLTECCIEMAFVLCAMREFDRALEMIEQAKSTAREHSPWYLGQATHREMNILVQMALSMNASLEVPLVWALDKYDAMEKPIPAMQKPVMVTAAIILTLTGQSGKALDVIGILESDERRDGRISMLMMLLPVKALALYHEGRIQEAFLALDEIVPVSVIEGSTQHFLDLHAPMQELLQTYAKVRPQNIHVSRILTAFDVKNEGFYLGDDGLIEELTPRELEVMEMIALGYANQDIAQKLFLAETTVKKHISNIFGKLGVKKRTQAVQRARELKLLP